MSSAEPSIRCSVKPFSPSAFRGEEILPPGDTGKTLSESEFKLKYPARARIYELLEGIDRNNPTAPLTADQERAFRFLKGLNCLANEYGGPIGKGDQQNSKMSLFTPRHHQSVAGLMIYKNLEAGKTSGYLRHGCASGKTLTYGNFLDKSGLRALILQPSWDLVMQTYRDINPCFPTMSIELGQLTGKAQVAVMTDSAALSAWKNGELNTSHFDIIIPDEAHKMLGPLRRKMIGDIKKSVPVLGFTATDRYYTNRTLSELLGDAWHILTKDEAVADSITAPFRVILVKTEADISQVNIEKRRYNTKELARAMHLGSTIKIGVELYKEQFNGQTAVVACGSLAEARAWASAFNEIGIPAATLHGKLPKVERRRIITALNNGELNVVAGKNLVTTGLSINRASLLYNAVPTLSAVDAEQRLGRIERIDPENPDKFSTVVEFLPRKEVPSRPCVLVSDILQGRVSIGSGVKQAKAEYECESRSFNVEVASKVIFSAVEVLALLKKRSDASGPSHHLGGKLLSLSEQIQMAKEMHSLYRRLAETVAAIPEFVQALAKAPVGAGGFFGPGLCDELKILCSYRENKDLVQMGQARIGKILAGHSAFNLIDPLVLAELAATKESLEKASPPISSERADQLNDLLTEYSSLSAKLGALCQELAERFYPMVMSFAQQVSKASEREYEDIENDFALKMLEAINQIPREEVHRIERFLMNSLERFSQISEKPPEIEPSVDVQQAIIARRDLQDTKIRQSQPAEVVLQKLDERERLDVLLGRFDPAERAIIGEYLKFNGRQSYPAIADTLHVSRSKVSNAIREFLATVEMNNTQAITGEAQDWMNKLGIPAELAKLITTILCYDCHFSNSERLHEISEDLWNEITPVVAKLDLIYQEFFAKIFVSHTYIDKIDIKYGVDLAQCDLLIRDHACVHLAHAFSFNGPHSKGVPLLRELSLLDAKEICRSQVRFSIDSVIAEASRMSPNELLECSTLLSEEDQKIAKRLGELMYNVERMGARDIFDLLATLRVGDVKPFSSANSADLAPIIPELCAESKFVTVQKLALAFYTIEASKDGDALPGRSVREELKKVGYSEYQAVSLCEIYIAADARGEFSKRYGVTNLGTDRVKFNDQETWNNGLEKKFPIALLKYNSAYTDWMESIYEKRRFFARRFEIHGLSSDAPTLNLERFKESHVALKDIKKEIKGLQFDVRHSELLVRLFMSAETYRKRQQRAKAIDTTSS